MEKNKTFKMIINESSSTSSISKKGNIKNKKIEKKSDKLSSLIEKQYCKNISNEIDDKKLEIFEVCLVSNKESNNSESEDSIIISDENKFKIINNNESIDSIILSD